ncbi:hypothetical protein C8Q78DRAFT_1150337 [Trametes maxima]|nr:hypothetical protein C8Q78DRAFT_1150337 [Trametes maxima]
MVGTSGTRFVFYDDPPQGPHWSFLNARSVRTNNVFAVDFDPCTSEPQATIIQPDLVSDASRPLILMFTPRHDVKCVHRTTQVDVPHPVVAQVAKNGSRYWDMYMASSDFNRVPHGSREVAVQTDSTEQQHHQRSTMSASHAPKTVPKVSVNATNVLRAVPTLQDSNSLGQPLPILAFRPACHASQVTEPLPTVEGLSDNNSKEPGVPVTISAPVTPRPASPSTESGYSADSDVDGSSNETGSTGDYNRLPDTLECIMEVCNLEREVEERETRITEVHEYMQPHSIPLADVGSGSSAPLEPHGTLTGLVSTLSLDECIPLEEPDTPEQDEYASLGSVPRLTDIVCDVGEADFVLADDAYGVQGSGLEDLTPSRDDDVGAPSSFWQVPEAPASTSRRATAGPIDPPAASPVSAATPTLVGCGPPHGVCNNRWDTLMQNAPWPDTEPDPFLPPYSARPHSPDLRQIPAHLLCIYAFVPWAHLQFNLPIIATNALLLCFAVIITLVSPSTSTPFLTLKKVNELMGLDIPFQVLAVCSRCKAVYSSSQSSPTRCTTAGCDTPLFKDTRSSSRWYQRGLRVPLIKYPYLSLSEQIEHLLQVQGMEELLERWRTKSRKPGVYRDIFDGSVAQNLLAPDGHPFFKKPEESDSSNELRIGLQWAVDWFSYLQSNIAPSHSSCPTSFAICNLPPEFRYRTANLLLTSILPGPKEQSPDELQRFIRPIDWIKQSDKADPNAFKEGVFPPRSNVEHRRLGARYAALSNQSQRDKFVKNYATRYTELSRLPYFDIVEQVVVDPMHNLFLGLVKTHFYHIWVQMGILRENHELRVLHDMLRDFSVPSSAGKLPKDIGTPAGGSLTADQWRLLALVHGPVLIPQLWRRCLPRDPTKLLNDRVERIAREEALRQAQLREKAARNRAQKKAPMVDASAAPPESSCFTTVPAHPSFLSPSPRPPTAVGTNRATPRSTTYSEATSSTSPLTAETSSPAPKRGQQVYCLHPDDPAHFLKLSEALKLLTAHVLTTVDIQEADRLLREYGQDIVRLYGPNAVRPNHHYATHVPDFALKFGPLHEFWSFLFERLNKVLKSFNANNRSDGELETTFFAEFHRTAGSSRVVAFMEHDMQNQPLLERLGAAMSKATHDGRGTVAGLAAWARQADEDLNTAHPWASPYTMSIRRETRTMSSQTYRDLLVHLRKLHPHWHLHSLIGKPRHPESVPLTTTAQFYDYVSLGGRRYYASNEANTKRSSLVEIYTPGPEPADASPLSTPSTHCGELEEIFEFRQSSTTPPFWFGRIRWFCEWTGAREPVWANSLHLGVRLWCIEEYDHGRDTIIPLTDIKGYVALQTVTVGTTDVKVWATVPLDNVSTLVN